MYCPKLKWARVIVINFLPFRLNWPRFFVSAKKFRIKFISDFSQFWLGFRISVNFGRNISWKATFWPKWYFIYLIFFSFFLFLYILFFMFLIFWLSRGGKPRSEIKHYWTITRYTRSSLFQSFRRPKECSCSYTTSLITTTFPSRIVPCTWPINTLRNKIIKSFRIEYKQQTFWSKSSIKTLNNGSREQWIYFRIFSPQHKVRATSCLT